MVPSEPTAPYTIWVAPFAMPGGPCGPGGPGGPAGPAGPPPAGLIQINVSVFVLQNGS